MKIVGVDIGGTQLRAAIFDEDMNMLDVFKTENDKTLGAAANVDKLIDFIMSKDYTYKAIGIGCPGPIDIKEGMIINPPNLYGWDNFKIVEYFENKTGIKTVMDSDGSIAAYAEYVMGNGQGFESIYFIGVSTGVGGGFIYKGELMSGAYSSGGQIYQMIVNEDKYASPNANPGSINEQCGGKGLRRVASQAYGYDVSPKELFQKYYAGDPLAAKLVEDCAENLGKAVANIACTVDPEAFVFGGSIALKEKGFVDKIAEHAKKYLIKPDKLTVRMAKFQDDAGLIGAALLVK